MGELKDILHYLVTGGAGFIGSCFVKTMTARYPKSHFIVLDKLTYAGRRENLSDIEGCANFTFVKGDIADANAVDGLFQKYQFDVVVNFAAETHVDRSIESPGRFIMTDIFGTYVLLEASRRSQTKRFVQISTDEVYGSIAQGSFSEDAALMPRNPYSASKAGADRLAYSYFTTYGLGVIITRCSNNYGPYQHPEKLIPLFVTNALEGKELPLYGDGKNIRDWIFVEDHVEALDLLIKKGRDGEVYNIGAGQDMENINVAEMICGELGLDKSRIKPVKDRMGHDRRYSLSCEKIKLLGWTARTGFVDGLTKTIDWYRAHKDWWSVIKSGEYADYYEKMYKDR